MPTKNLPNGKGDTVYSFGGGANTVLAQDDDPLNYQIDLGGGDDSATLGAGQDTVIGGSGSDIIAGGRGDDVLYGGDTIPGASSKASTDTLYGDYATTISSNTIVLGNDLLIGAGGSALFTNNLFGDAAALDGDAAGGRDTLNGGTLGVNNLYGDAGTISGGGAGGADVITGGNQAQNTLYGDAGYMGGSAIGGNDVLTGGNNGGFNLIYGDAATIVESAVAGNDTLVGGNSASNTLIGDGSISRSSGSFGSGNDVLTGGTGAGTSNTLIGDGSQLNGSSSATITGGNDILTGGSGVSNTLYGDAVSMTANGTSFIKGGDDRLTAGDGGTNTLYGDALSQAGNVASGNDTLISGTGDDTMWGDVATVKDTGAVAGGADIFVFLTGSGNDTIMDFGEGADKIDLSAYGVVTAEDAANYAFNITTGVNGPTIHLAGGGSITLQDYLGPIDASILKVT